MKRSIYLWKFPIIKIKRDEYYEKRYFLGIQYKVVKFKTSGHDFSEIFDKKNIQGISGKDIRVILVNLGEPLVYARTHQYWYKPEMLLFATKPQHREIFRMFAPEIPVFYFDNQILNEQKVDSNGNNFRAVLFCDKLREMNLSGKPFIQSWQEYLKADFSSLAYSKAKISEESRIIALQKASALGINLDKFVFLMPFASSQYLLPGSFWEEIRKKLKANGVDVMYNSDMFTLEESYVLAEHSKAIVSLRSGFNDVLSEINVPQHAIYTCNRWSGDLQMVYGLKTFPWSAAEYITEYNIKKQSMEDIKRTILEKVLASAE